MKKKCFLFVMLISFSVMSLFAKDVVNFSGTWTLDESKLQPNEEGMPRMEATKIIVKQNKDSLSAERFLSNPMMGDFTITEDVTLDGKECKSDTEFGLRKSTAVWSEDKKELTINTTIVMNWDGQENEMKTTQIMSLEKDGAVLKIQATRNSPMGEMKTTVYYNKSK